MVLHEKFTFCSQEKKGLGLRYEYKMNTVH